MATKKQKREAALAKREAFLKKERERGLSAQKDGHIAEERERENLKAKIDLINERHRTILAGHGIVYSEESKIAQAEHDHMASLQN